MKVFSRIISDNEVIDYFTNNHIKYSKKVLKTKIKLLREINLVSGNIILKSHLMLSEYVTFQYTEGIRTCSTKNELFS